MVRISYLFLIIALFISCKDEDLVLPRTPNNSNLLKLNGYYFHNPTGIDSNITVVDFLYTNGISLNIGGTQSKDLTVIEENLKKDLNFADNKIGWGVYVINNDNIEIENWAATEGKRKTSSRKGKILNDSTFVITRFFSAFTQKEYEISDSYHFKAYSPKPDSTNSFIK